MALSPYLKPSVLNGGLTGSGTKLTGAYASMYGMGKDFDKRNGANGTTETISNFKTVTEMLTNALGSRSPYYTIGEVQSTALGDFAARYMQDALGNIVRAVTSIYDTATERGQTGVIIDGFGDVTGDIDVEFTKNPVIFVSNSVTDGRYRTPNSVTMTVYVSNFYNDDGLGAAVDYLTAFDPTGIASEAVNILANNGNTRAQEALYNLRRIQETGIPFRLYTPHGVYENMAIKTLRPRTTGENVDMLECTIVFQELIMYEPYYDEAEITYPTRTNILSKEEGSTLSSILNGKSDAGKKILQMAKMIGA